MKTLTNEEANALILMFDCIEMWAINSHQCAELWNNYKDVMEKLGEEWSKLAPAVKEEELMADMTNCVLPLNEPIILERNNNGRIGYKYANRPEQKAKRLWEILLQVSKECDSKNVILEGMCKAEAQAAKEVFREMIERASSITDMGVTYLSKDDLKQKLTEL